MNRKFVAATAVVATVVGGLVYYRHVVTGYLRRYLVVPPLTAEEPEEQSRDAHEVRQYHAEAEARERLAQSLKEAEHGSG